MAILVFLFIISQHTNVLLHHSFDSLQVPIVLLLMVRQLTQDEILQVHLFILSGGRLRFQCYLKYFFNIF